MKWKYKVGEVLELGKDNRIVIIGTREEQCLGGIQRFYLAYGVVKSFDRQIGVTNQAFIIPEIVMDEMVKMGKKEENNEKCLDSDTRKNKRFVE